MMKLNEAAIMAMRDISYLMEDTIKKIDRLEQDLEFEKHRGAGLANDKIVLTERLKEAIASRSWESIASGKCPENVRVMVKGKDHYVMLATLKAGTWLNNRMLLDFSPTYWMQVPE